MHNLINQIRHSCYECANTIIKQICEIVDFFSSKNEKAEFIASYECTSEILCEDRVAYGDWQTPVSLAEKVCNFLAEKYGSPDIVIEPTCGMGAFVLSALKLFPNIKEIHALETQQFIHI